MKIFSIIIVFFLITGIRQAFSSSIIAQGNIIYIKSSKQATINPVLINFHKGYNFETIDLSLNTLDQFFEAYNEFCMDTLRDNYVHPTIVPIRTITFREAQYKCTEYDSQLPEIKTIEQSVFLAQQMVQHNLTKTFAGVVFKDDQLVYLSDLQPIEYNHIKMCNDCNTERTYTIEDHNAQKALQGSEIHFYYETTPKKALHLVPVGHQKNASCPSVPMLCFKHSTAIPTTLSALAKHNCLRDQEELQTNNINIREEVRQFHSPTLTRQKRAIGLIGAGIGAGFLGVETLNSILGNYSPLSIMGKGIASVFGFATEQDMKMTRKQLEAHSKALQDLAVNQKQLIEGYKAVQADIDLLKKANMKQEHDVAVLFANLDNKLAIRNLQTILQITLVKMSQAIASAIQHHTSPYVFGVADLQNLTSSFRYQGIPLTAELNDVYTTLAIVDNMYTFIFSAPILTQENDMFLYEIRDLPIYNNKIQYRLNITNRFIAVNFNTDEYVILSPTEYYHCLNSHLCMAASSFLTIGKDSPCEVLSLKYQTQHCDLYISKEPMPNFLTYYNVTYYSLPMETEVQIICKDTQASVTQYKQLYGTGELQTAPGCTLNINKQISVRPSYVLSRHNLEGDSFFKFLKVPDMPLHKYPTTTKAPNTTLSPFQFRDVSSIGEAVNVVFNHDTTVAELIRILCYIVAILSILATIYCCYPRFRLWFNGCCFIQKPTKYWRDVKGYKVPDFISKDKQTKQQDTDINPDERIINLDNEDDNTLTENNEKPIEHQYASIKSSNLRSLKTPNNIYQAIKRPQAPPPPIPPPPPPTIVETTVVSPLSPLPIRPVETPASIFSTFRPYPFNKIPRRLYDPIFVPNNSEPKEMTPMTIPQIHVQK